MFLSRLILNPRSRQVRRELVDVYELHRTVMQSFAGTLQPDERILFRLDVHPKTGIPTLLVQSQHEPNWAFLCVPEKDYLLTDEDLPLNIENPAVKPIEISLSTGQVLAFRLRANPTMKKVIVGKRQGQRLGLLHEDDQRKWLERKLQQAGGLLLSTQICDEGLATGKYASKTDTNKPVRLLSVQFDGVLRVMDPIALQNALREGLGSGKGFGFGLLSLAPARGL